MKMGASQGVLHAVPKGFELVEFNLQMPRRQNTSSKTTLMLRFVGEAGHISLLLVSPYPLDATFAVTDDAADIKVLDSASDHWEDKKVRLEFLTGEGQV